MNNVYMDFLGFLYSFGITLSFSFLSAFYYFKIYLKKDIAFATAFYGLLVFCIVYFVSFESNIGLGIGLLGILSLIRLRSTPENLVDIGFIFYAITIGLLNASLENDLLTIVSIDFFLTIILILLVFISNLGKNIVSTRITFDDIDFEKLDSERYLRERVHESLNITPLTLRVTRVDYLKDSVNVRITYELKN